MSFAPKSANRRLVSTDQLRPPSPTNKVFSPIRRPSAGVQTHMNHNDRGTICQNIFFASTEIFLIFKNIFFLNSRNSLSENSLSALPRLTWVSHDYAPVDNATLLLEGDLSNMQSRALPANKIRFAKENSMSAYVVVDLEIIDSERFERYKQLVPATIEKYGGRYMARGGKVQTLEGMWEPKRFVLLEFPSVDRAKAWFDSAEYAEAKALRQSCTRSRIVVVEGI